MSEAVSPPVVRDAIDVRRFPWIRPLSAAFSNDFASVAPLFAGDPASPDAWRGTIARVQRAGHDRLRLSALVDRQLDQRQAPAAAREAAARLRDSSSVAVVTGQQAGVFGGPLYTLLKAITALQLADRVRREFGTPATAVFWIDEEDHDWNEIRSAELLDDQMTMRKVSVADVEGAGQRPVSALVLDDGINDAIAELEQALPPSEFRSELLTALRRAYEPGVGVARACAHWLDALLGPLGLVVFEAADPGAKSIAAELFAREFEHPGQTCSLALQAGAEMARLGHQPQVQPAEDGVAVFLVDAEGRHAIKHSAGRFLVGERSFAPQELAAAARATPAQFSPNVLLRPLVQDAIFPTICYVGGPSELAYHAQLKPVYQAFGIEPPLLYPRASVTLLDAGAQRFLDKYPVPLEDLSVQDDSVLNRLLESQLPPTIDRALEDIAREVSQRTDALKQEVTQVDPTLAGTVDTTADKIRDVLKTLHHKIVQASKRKDDTLRRQFQRARTLAFPGGQPQERVLNMVFFLNRYGLTLPGRLLETLPIDTSKHYVLTL